MDKILHILISMIFVWVLYRFSNKEAGLKHILIWASITVFVIGLCKELIFDFIDKFNYKDLIANVIGIAIGVILIIKFFKHEKKL